MVPFTKDPKFIDRVEIFENIEERAKMQSRVALSGIGGVGWVSSRVYILDAAKIALESRRSPSSTVIGSEKLTPMLTLSGFTPAQLNGSIKHIKI